MFLKLNLLKIHLQESHNEVPRRNTKISDFLISQLNFLNISLVDNPKNPDNIGFRTSPETLVVLSGVLITVDRDPWGV